MARKNKKSNIKAKSLLFTTNSRLFVYSAYLIKKKTCEKEIGFLINHRTAVVNIAATGSASRNLMCFVLCLNANIPQKAPIPPPEKAHIMSVRSEIRHFPFIARCLSAAYIKNTYIFQAISVASK